MLAEIFSFHWEGTLTIGDLLALMGELIVAWVIYRELTAAREETFLTHLDESTYVERAELYKEFVAQVGETASDRAKAFADAIRADSALRVKVEKQMVVFSRAFVLLRSFWFRPNLMIEWYPHVILKMWVVCHVYILEHDAGVFRWDVDMWSELVPRAMKSLEISQLMRGRSEEALVIYSGEKVVRVTPTQLRKIASLASVQHIPAHRRASAWAKWWLRRWKP